MNKIKEIKLVSEKMIGIVLMNAEKDSNGLQIEPMEYYKVQKHIPTGKLIIERIGENMRTEFYQDTVLPAMSKLN